VIIRSWIQVNWEELPVKSTGSCCYLLMTFPCPSTWGASSSPPPLLSSLQNSLQDCSFTPYHREKFNTGNFLRYLQLALVGKIFNYLMMIHKWAKFQMGFWHDNIDCSLVKVAHNQSDTFTWPSHNSTTSGDKHISLCPSLHRIKWTYIKCNLHHIQTKFYERQSISSKDIMEGQVHKDITP
jgi:hypothetical protein